MGEVAGVQPRFLCLFLVMREQRVEFVDHRLHLERQRRGDAVVLPAAHRRDGAADVTQRPEAVDGLERGEHDQAEAEQEETGEQGRSDENTSELQSLLRNAYDVFNLNTKKNI